MPLRKLQEIIIAYAQYLFTEGRFRAVSSSIEYPYNGPAFAFKQNGKYLEFIDNTQESFTLPDGEEIVAPVNHRDFREPKTNQVRAAFLKFQYWEKKIHKIWEDDRANYSYKLQRELEIITSKLLQFAVDILKPAAESYALLEIDTERGQKNWTWFPCDLRCRSGVLESGESVPAEIQVQVEEFNDLLRETERHITDVRECESRSATPESQDDASEAFQLLREMIAEYAARLGVKASEDFGEMAVAKPKRKDVVQDEISYKKNVRKKAVNQSEDNDGTDGEPKSDSTGRRSHPAKAPIIQKAPPGYPEPMLQSDDRNKRTKPRKAKTASNLPTASARRQAVDAYIEEVFQKTKKRITRADIWKLARYRNPTDFERWQRKDPRATKTADERFTRLLNEKPHLK